MLGTLLTVTLLVLLRVRLNVWLPTLMFRVWLAVKLAVLLCVRVWLVEAEAWLAYVELTTLVAVMMVV